jgi:hypothetical protein
MLRFQCPCGFGDHEVDHMVGETDIYCIVCLEEEGRRITLHCWEEQDQARLRLAAVA